MSGGKTKTRSGDDETGRKGRIAFGCALALVLVASMPLHLGHPTADVSWLLTVCEKMLDGERLFVDILEINPPFSALLYMPAVLLARAIGISPETVTFAMAYLAAFAGLGLAARILPEEIVDGGKSSALVLLPAAFFLLVLSQDAFAQREFFAAAFALPIVAVFLRHGRDGSWPSLTDGAAAAILAGLTIAIKPPLFILPGLFIAAHMVWRTKSLAFLLPSGLFAAGLFGVAVTVVSFAAFPHYFGETAALMREVYLPVRSDFLSCLNDRGFVAVLALLGISGSLMLRLKPVAAQTTALLAATGFLTAYFLQGKYFPYQVFPAGLFALIAAVIGVFRHLQTVDLRALGPLLRSGGFYVLASVGIALSFLAGFTDQRPGMPDLSWADGLDRPTALAVSPDHATSFPLARRIGARWVGRAHSQWVARFARHALASPGLSEAEPRKFERYHGADLRGVLERIEAAKPELLFLDAAPAYAWFYQELQALNPGYLKAYAPVAESAGIRVLKRRSDAPAGR